MKQNYVTKKKILLAVVASFALFVTLCKVLGPQQLIQADYPYYPDVSSISEEADEIIVGEVIEGGIDQNLVVDRTANRTNVEPLPYKLATIKVLEAVKGTLEVGEVITVKQLANDAETEELDGYLKSGETSLMFLAAYEMSPYSLLNPTQGKVEVLDNNTLYSPSPFSLFGYGQTVTRGTSAETLEDAIAEIKASLK